MDGPDNEIGAAGAAALVEGLKEMRNLKDLNLNFFGFCHSSAGLGKTKLFSKVSRFVSCLFSLSQKLKGRALFTYFWEVKMNRP